MLPFILVWQLASVGRSPAEATISIDFRSGIGSVVPGIGSGRKFIIKNSVAPLMRGYICGCVSSQKIALAVDLHRELSEEIHCSCEVGQLKEILWKL
jgi:hypothetical protein